MDLPALSQGQGTVQAQAEFQFWQQHANGVILHYMTDVVMERRWDMQACRHLVHTDQSPNHSKHSQAADLQKAR